MKLDGFGVFLKDMVMIRFYRDVVLFEIKELKDIGIVYLQKDGILFFSTADRILRKLLNTALGMLRVLAGNLNRAERRKL